MDGEINVAGSNAAQQLRNVLDDGLTPVIELGLTHLPRLRVSDHAVQLANGCYQDVLSVLQYLGVSACAVLVTSQGGLCEAYHLPSRCLFICNDPPDAGCAYPLVVLAPFAGDLTIALVASMNSTHRVVGLVVWMTYLYLLHSTPHTCLPNPPLGPVRHSPVHASMAMSGRGPGDGTLGGMALLRD